VGENAAYGADSGPIDVGQLGAQIRRHSPGGVAFTPPDSAPAAG
jgi:hypothetical protein